MFWFLEVCFFSMISFASVLAAEILYDVFESCDLLLSFGLQGHRINVAPLIANIN